MSFCATEPSLKRNLRIGIKHTEHQLPQPGLCGPPAAGSQPPQVKSLLELTVLVKKIESLARFLVICTTALSQLMVAAG